MNDQAGKQSSILSRIIDGSVTIDSILNRAELIKTNISLQDRKNLF
jgi:hypothetical protein